MKNKSIIPFIISIVGVVLALCGTIYQIIAGKTGWTIILLFLTVLASVWFGISLIIVICEAVYIDEEEKKRKNLEEIIERFRKELEYARAKKEEPFEEFCGGSDNDKGTGKRD